MRPDLRELGKPRLSGAPLHDNEIDYDEVIINRHWRAYEPDRPGEVRYWMYEFSQRNPGEEEFWHGFKAVRFLRLTRVPRWLRQQSSGIGRPGFTQMAYVLSALREQGILFVQMVAKTPEIPLVFAYGVQAVAETEAEACRQADEAYAALVGMLDGQFQQLEYAPIKLEEAEKLARYQATWRDIAVARGRPISNSESVGAAAVLDGNRTDIEQTHNQMEAFIRGMSESRRGFMLNLISVPISPGEMNLALSKVSQHLSVVRSETHGTRSANFGAAIPLAVGNSMGTTHGDNHSSSLTHGVGASEGFSHAEGASSSFTSSEGVTATQTHGVSESLSEGASMGRSVGTSEGISVGTSEGISLGTSEGLSSSVGQSLGQSLSEGTSQSLSAGQSVSHGQSLSEGISQSHSLTEGVSRSDSIGVSESRSLGESVSSGQNWSSSVSDAFGATVARSEGLSNSFGVTQSQSLALSEALGESVSLGENFGQSSSLSGQLGLVSGGLGESAGESLGVGLTNTNTLGLTQTGGNTLTTGISDSMSQGLSQTITRGESAGGSLGQSLTASNTVGASQGQSFGQSLSSAQTVGSSLSQGQSLGIGQSLSETAGVSRSLGSSIGTSESVGHNVGQSASASQGMSQGVNQGVSQSATESATRTAGIGRSASVAEGVTATTSQGTGTTATDTASLGTSQQQSLADAYMVAMSRQASNTGSLGVVPSFGVSVAKQTFDAAKALIGDILEETQRRYMDGNEGGGWLYQMSLIAEDRETLAAGAALLKSSFWGPGTRTERLSQPFHVITDINDVPNTPDPEGERERLLRHAQLWTSYRRREPVMELIEPFMYSSFVTVGELAAFSRPPVAESIGLLAVHDSAPVMAMPADRQNREITVGRLFNGERAVVSKTKFGVDTNELTHMLVTGVTGSGKTTTLMKILSDMVTVKREVVLPASESDPTPVTREVPASILALDWMRNMRHLGSLLDPVRVDPDTGEKSGRFQFFSVSDPDLGLFRWNPLEIPDEGMSPVEWLNSQADNMVASWNLGEFGRSLIAEFIERLYSANRLEPFVLRPERQDEETGEILRDPVLLPPIPREQLPDDAIAIDETTGEEVANVYTYPQLSRTIGLEHLAIIVAAEVEIAGTLEGARMSGTSMRDRLQSLWRRISFYGPNGQFSNMITYDEDLESHTTLSIPDLVDPARGLVSVIETDGLDLANRRFILGSVMLSLYRWALHHGEGCLDMSGRAPGTFVVLEEAHELFGAQGVDEDNFSASTRTALYESMHRRIRALGARLIDVVQNPGDIPESVTSNTSTVIVHRTYADADRRRVFSLLNWNNQVGQQQREYRYLGELPVGHAIVRLHARKNFLESAPIHIVSDSPTLGKVTDKHLAAWAKMR